MEIQGYPDYLIHEDGKVWSKPRSGTRGKWSKGGWIKPTKSRGYHRIGLRRDGKQKFFSVSRLVAQHYIPNPENKPEVDHIDRDKDNNHVSNLRWATSKENNHNRRKIMRNNTSGHQYIYSLNRDQRWIFRYLKHGYKIANSFKTKQDAIHYKFFFLLKLNLEMKHNGIQL